MGSRWLFKIAILSLLLITGGCGRKYVFKSDPSEASVYLNDTLVGKTPVEVSTGDLPSTPNIRVKVVKEGYSTFTGIIPSPSMATLKGDVSVALNRGEDEIDKINRNMGLIINAEKLVMVRHYPEALKLTEEAIAENPRYVYAQLLKGSILFLSKDFTSAFKQYQKVIEIDAANTEAIRMVNYLRSTGGIGRMPASEKKP